MNLKFSNLIGTIKTTFNIGKLLVDANALTVAKTISITDTTTTVPNNIVASGTASFGGSVSANRIYTIDTSGRATMRYDDASVINSIIFQNLDTTSTTNHGNLIKWQFGTNTTQTPIDAGTVNVLKEQQWTTTAATQNAFMVFGVCSSGSIAEAGRITSGRKWGLGTPSPIGQLDIKSTGNSSSTYSFGAQNSSAVYALVVRDDSRVGILQVLPTARLHLGAGTASAGTSSFKIDTGTLLTTPEAGAIEHASSKLYFTPADATRRQIHVNGSANPSAITVGASPFTYQNTTDYAEQIIVSGGVFTNAEFSRDNTNFFTVFNTIVVVTLNPGDRLKVTYSSTPSMTKIPI